MTLLALFSVRACAQGLALAFSLRCFIEESRGNGLTAWTAIHAGLVDGLVGGSQGLDGLHDRPVLMVRD